MQKFMNIRFILKISNYRLLPFWSIDFAILSGVRNGTDDIFREITGVPGVSWPMWSVTSEQEQCWNCLLIFQLKFYSVGQVKFPNFFTATPKNFLYGPASTLSTKFFKLSIRNHLGHSLEVLGRPQLQYSLAKITSPNLTFLFDCNFLGLLVDEQFMVCPTTFNMKILKLSIRNHLGHSLEVLGWPQLQYSLSKITSPNLILLFDYNFLVLLVDEDFMVCPTTFIMKILKFRGTSGYWPWL